MNFRRHERSAQPTLPRSLREWPAFARNHPMRATALAIFAAAGVALVWSIEANVVAWLKPEVGSAEAHIGRWTASLLGRGGLSTAQTLTVGSSVIALGWGLADVVVLAGLFARNLRTRCLVAFVLLVSAVGDLCQSLYGVGEQVSYVLGLLPLPIILGLVARVAASGALEAGENPDDNDDPLWPVFVWFGTFVHFGLGPKAKQRLLAHRERSGGCSEAVAR